MTYIFFTYSIKIYKGPDVTIVRAVAAINVYLPTSADDAAPDASILPNATSICAGISSAQM